MPEAKDGSFVGDYSNSGNEEREVKKMTDAIRYDMT